MRPQSFDISTSSDPALHSLAGDSRFLAHVFFSQRNFGDAVLIVLHHPYEPIVNVAVAGTTERNGARVPQSYSLTFIVGKGGPGGSGGRQESTSWWRPPEFLPSLRNDVMKLQIRRSGKVD